MTTKLEQLRSLEAEVGKCTKCKDLAASRTQTVFGVGNHDADLVFIGEAPGEDEDKQGEPFVGEAGKRLTKIIEQEMKLRRGDVYICNILRCRPPENRDPKADEVNNCRHFLDETLTIIKPKFICCLGEVAAQRLLRTSTSESLESLRGKIHDYNGISVVCTNHPTSRTTNEERSKDIKLLMKVMGRK
ncbi:MAG: uracil-DNA glycosylase [Thermoguttaceae bacterium]